MVINNNTKSQSIEFLDSSIPYKAIPWGATVDAPSDSLVTIKRNGEITGINPAEVSATSIDGVETPFSGTSYDLAHILATFL